MKKTAAFILTSIVLISLISCTSSRKISGIALNQSSITREIGRMSIEKHEKNLIEFKIRVPVTGLWLTHIIIDKDKRIISEETRYNGYIKNYNIKMKPKQGNKFEIGKRYGLVIGKYSIQSYPSTYDHFDTFFEFYFAL